MKQSVRNALYQAILDNHWVDVKYKNAKNEDTEFFVGINDIDVAEDKLYCEIFNSYKDNRCLESPMPISISRIYYARVLEQSYYPTPKLLLSRLDYDKELLNFLEVNSMDNDILRYLSECYNLDNDPYIKDKVLLEGVDCDELIREKKYKLDDNQFEALLNNLFKADIFAIRQAIARTLLRKPYVCLPHFYASDTVPRKICEHLTLVSCCSTIIL